MHIVSRDAESEALAVARLVTMVGNYVMYNAK